MNVKKNTAPPKLDRQRIAELRQLAHKLKPVIQVGQKGLSDAVIKELDGALTYHELVKIKIAAGDREARSEIIQQAAKATAAEIVQSIGGTATLYRHNPDKNSTN